MGVYVTINAQKQVGIVNEDIVRLCELAWGNEEQKEEKA